MRSAAALEVDAVLLSSDCSDPLCRRAIRVSMGTVFMVPWTVMPYGKWPGEAIGTLKKLGYMSVALALTPDAQPLGADTLRGAGRIALVLGSEGYGLRDESIAACDMAVQIPMRVGVDSLNVAAASAVAFWEVGKYCR